VAVTDLASKLTQALKSLDRFQQVNFDIKESEYASGERDRCVVYDTGSID